VAAHIVEIGLAGAFRIPEQAQQVVPELKRLAQRQPVRGIPLAQPPAGAGQRTADQLALIDGLLGAL
jgi:hypothetical protein